MLNASMRTMYHTAPQSPSPQKKKVKRSKIKQNKTSGLLFYLYMGISTSNISLSAYILYSRLY